MNIFEDFTPSLFKRAIVVSRLVVLTAQWSYRVPRVLARPPPGHGIIEIEMSSNCTPPLGSRTKPRLANEGNVGGEYHFVWQSPAGGGAASLAATAARSLRAEMFDVPVGGAGGMLVVHVHVIEALDGARLRVLDHHAVRAAEIAEAARRHGRIHLGPFGAKFEHLLLRREAGRRHRHIT